MKVERERHKRTDKKKIKKIKKEERYRQEKERNRPNDKMREILGHT
jgi:hypothetical protein